MKRAYIGWAAIVAALLLISTCTWVKVSPEARKVNIVEAGEVIGCERLGEISVATWASYGLFDRYAKSVNEELAALARGSAVDLGGNTLVPLTKVIDGRQRYAVYRCPRME